MANYALDNAWDQARRRLDLLEQQLDPMSQLEPGSPCGDDVRKGKGRSEQKLRSAHEPGPSLLTHHCAKPGSAGVPCDSERRRYLIKFIRLCVTPNE
jgi:hypothetical protein